MKTRRLVEGMDSSMQEATLRLISVEQVAGDTTNKVPCPVAANAKRET